MKTLSMLAFLTVCVAASTNQLYTVTNQAGVTFHDARIVKAEPDGLTFIGAGGGGKIPFEYLPKTLQETFAYDPARAALYRAQQKHQASERESARLQAAAALTKARADEQAFEKKKTLFFAHGLGVAGKIIQKTEKHLFVELHRAPHGTNAAAQMVRDSDIEASFELLRKEYEPSRPEPKFVVLLRDHPTFEELEPGQWIALMGYEPQKYTYKSIIGKTVTRISFTTKIPAEFQTRKPLK